jgi:hypothetical protein
MFIATLIMSLVGFVGLVIGRLKGYGQITEHPYRRVHGDAPGAWRPGER